MSNLQERINEDLEQNIHDRPHSMRNAQIGIDDLLVEHRLLEREDVVSTPLRCADKGLDLQPVLLSIQQDVQAKLAAAAAQPRKAPARSLDLSVPAESAQ